MNGKWRKGQLGDFIELKRGFDLPKSKRILGRFPLVSSSGVSDWHNIAMAKGPGVVTGRYGTIGEVFFVEDDFWPLNTTLYVCDFKGNDPKFINYFLKTIDFQAYSDKAAVPGINRNHLHKAEVRIPDFETQKLIAYILGTIDDKIALNHQINQTLEAMAQAIFKSWFVDFEPVRAKVAALELGEDPTCAAMRAIAGKNDDELDTLQTADATAYAQLQTTASLFPDEFEESELGLVPKGWEVGALSDFCKLNNHSWSGSALPPVIHYVDLANTKDGEINSVQEFIKEDAPSRARRILKQGDTVVGTVRPGNRSFAFIGQPDNTLTGSTGFAVLTPRKIIYQELIYLIATSEENIARLTHLADGGAYPAVRPDVVIKEACLIAPDKVHEAFHSLTSPLFRLRQEFITANQTLFTLRDTLLPKLLSGELSVSNSEVEADAIA